MKVILQADVKKLGNKGDLVDVAEGYARNFLIPRGLAVAANEANLRSLKVSQSQAQAKQEREKEAARQVAAELEGLHVKIEAKTGDSGRLFGSVTAADIAEAVKGASGHELDRRKIDLDEPIKNLGTYQISVGVHPGISAKLRVEVVPAQGDSN